MRFISALAAATLAAACAPGPPPPPPPPPAASGLPRALADSAQSRVNVLADEYVAAFFSTFPEMATRRGIPHSTHERLTDNSLAAQDRWIARERAWLVEVGRIDTTSVVGRPEWATYAILRETLESGLAQRVCRFDLWNVSTSPASWQASYADLARLQPVGSDSLREQALTRARSLPRFIDTEIANLREGLKRGYVAPRILVVGVIKQLDGLLATPPHASPFASPGQRDSTPGFAQRVDTVIATDINPAIQRYRDYLTAYLPYARATVGASASPGGADCYRASVRRFATLDISPDEVYDRGLAELARIEAEIRTLGQQKFGTSDVPALLRRMREDTTFTFRTRQEIVDSSEAALARARMALPKWFGLLPKAAFVIEQDAEFRQRAGAVPHYNPPAEDGSRPGIFYIVTYRPEQYSRAMLETTAFHEAIPGHHLQGTIAQERASSHPIARYFFNSGYGEGWALYAEGLSAEMGLFGSDVGRLGLLASQAWRAARLAIDAGVHTRGWTREQAMEFLATHTAVAPLQVAGEVDRYISWPGQATSYMLGNLEILSLRAEATRRLGPRFDIRAFHDQVLGDGAVPLPMLRHKIERWIETEAASK
jgi:uncharacterized protein (DUF885 family)